MATMDEILAKKKPNQKTVEILLDSTLKGEIDRLEREKVRAASRKRTLADPSPDSIQSQIDELYDKAVENSASFTFRDIGRKAYDALVTEHPPTKEQKDEYKAQEGPGVLSYNPDSFPAALISACAVEPEITLPQAQQIMDEWSEGDAETLFLAAVAVCKERTSIPFGRSGSAATLDSNLSSNTVLSGESPTPSS